MTQNKDDLIFFLQFFKKDREYVRYSYLICVQTIDDISARKYSFFYDSFAFLICITTLYAHKYQQKIMKKRRGFISFEVLLDKENSKEKKNKINCLVSY
jgi:hypothetical protein